MGFLGGSKYNNYVNIVCKLTLLTSPSKQVSSRQRTLFSWFPKPEGESKETEKRKPDSRQGESKDESAAKRPKPQ